jgi:hypothetical protein
VSSRDSIHGLDRDNYTLTVTRTDAAVVPLAIAFNAAVDHGFIAVVPPGKYRVAVQLRTALDVGRLTENAPPDFTVTHGELLVGNVTLNGAAQLSVGALAGIAVGAIVAVVAVIVVLVLVLRRRSAPSQAISLNTTERYTGE